MFSTIIVTDMCGILPCFIVMASNVHNVYNVRKKEMHTKHFIHSPIHACIHVCLFGELVSEREIFQFVTLLKSANEIEPVTY